ncbi:NAD(P)-binding protein [Mycobacterium arosiense]|uniref:Amine oxidase domain-containing protein n=1 Tax=Mycobacterium arosiense ATCC BAA-1401 = DSM 45069 TaxID=1265311 RepID=A0A1W9ZBI2_MYCAI|nr:NAD(P)-binding protein [Mycobacterium arosiense]ORA11279.1 hypothetical protein BST14_18930 [Mycobacterium arosiense ATCC BAA-1401 = DSM 45069]
MDHHDSEHEDYDVIVVGAGTSGAVCAGTLASRGARVLLISETATPGYNVRCVPLDGHLAYIQQPPWHMSWGGGHWARVARELNLPVRAHAAPPISVMVRGSRRSTRMPLIASTTELCELLFHLTEMPREILDRGDTERVLRAGLAIPPGQLCKMHDVGLEQWFDRQQADQPTRLVIELLAAVVAGVSSERIGKTFSVFGAFALIRTCFAGEGIISVIEPDIQRGLIQPLTNYVQEHGGVVWRGTKVQRVLVEREAVRGVQMTDGRTATASHVALAVGNQRIPAFFTELPAELCEPLRKEAAFEHDQVTIATLLTRPVVDVTDKLLIHDPATGANVWFVPLNVVAPWNSPDARQLCLQWWGGPARGHNAVVNYLDDVCEDAFPGWKAAVGQRAPAARRYHWLNSCYAGAKVPRRSPTIERLWYVGESTEPVAGIATEQAAFAGYHGALAIGAHPMPSRRRRLTGRDIP